MSFIKNIMPLCLVLLTTSCISLSGIELPAYQSTSTTPFAKFACDNGYKVLVSYQSEERIVVSFNNGKDTFVVPVYKSHIHDGKYYIGETQTVKWQEHQGMATLTYPDNNYRTTQKIWETQCRPR